MSCGCSEPDRRPERSSRLPPQRDLRAELTAGLISPRPGAGVCPRCFDLTDAARRECSSCARCEQQVAAMTPISYSVGGERLHHDIAAYKRLADPSVPDATARLSELLGRFLAAHEHCVAAAACLPGFDLVTTVPSGSGTPARDEHHPLRRIVAAIPATASRHERLLLPAVQNSSKREFDPARYRATRRLDGLNVLLIDDMWTTGASVQSAAAALHASGAANVGAVVIGRHLNRGWADNDLRLRRLTRTFSWDHCPLCAGLPRRRVADGLVA